MKQDSRENIMNGSNRFKTTGADTRIETFISYLVHKKAHKR
jgi:hypothetical protein